MLHKQDTAPSVGWNSLFFFLSVYSVNGPYGKWKGSSFDTINFNLSVPWYKASEHAFYSGAKLDSVSPLWTFNADFVCGGGAGCV